MNTAVSPSLPDTTTEERSARLVRWLLATLLTLGAAAWLGLFAQAFWAENEFTQPESLIANQATNLREAGVLYYPLDQYPYMVSNYMPLTYALGAAGQALGLEPIHAGRLVSMLALCWLGWLVWRVVGLYTGDERAAVLAAALCSCSVTLATWGTVGQADLLAVASTVAAFYEFSKVWRGVGDGSLWRAGLFTLAGVFAKQTVIAVPMVIAWSLWTRWRRSALGYVAGVALGGAVLALAVEALCPGRFFLNAIGANMNPLSAEKFAAQASFWASTCGGLALIAVVGGRELWRESLRPVLLWAVAAVAVLALTGGKIGSDLNYQVEATVALIVAACVALEALGFFRVVFTGSKSPVTLLLMPLLVFAAVNLRVELAIWMSRQAKEAELRTQVAQLAPRLPLAGRILSADMNVLERLGKRIEVDPFMYRVLVEARKVAPARLTEDLKHGLFATVLLYHPAGDREEPGLEVPTLTREQRAIVAERYQQVAWVPGPYAGGLYVYEPR